MSNALLANTQHQLVVHMKLFEQSIHKLYETEMKLN